MTWTGKSIRTLTADELAADGVRCKGSDHCNVIGEHPPRYLLEAVNTDTGEIRRALFCLRAGGAAAYKLGITFPPGPPR